MKARTVRKSFFPGFRLPGVVMFLIVLTGCSRQEEDSAAAEKATTFTPDSIQGTTTIPEKEDNQGVDLRVFGIQPVSYPDRIRDSLIRLVADDYPFYYKNELYEYQPPPAENFTFADLNGDNIPEIIYQGWSGSEPEMVQIHFSTPEGYTRLHQFYQYLEAIRMKSGRIKDLVINDPGCCDEFVYQEFTFRFDDSLNYDTVRHRLSVGRPFERKPVGDKKPVYFTVTQDRYKLRYKPVVDDTTTADFDHNETHPGNTLAVFKKGARGRVLAVDRNDPVRDWWYVEMEPITDTLEFDVFKRHDTGMGRRMGWMSARFLTTD